ncbi:MAG: flippase-like domain-containing protein [FCB group bacterium]|nr:flippase-like domain-containing protein [FCB group bacterium]
MTIWKKILNFLKSPKVSLPLGIFISLACLYWAFHDFDLVLFYTALKSTNYFYILLACAIMVLTLWIRGIRWTYLLSEEKKLTAYQLFRMESIGYFGSYVLPLRLGELLRTYVLSKEEKMSGTVIFGSIVLERILDTFGLMFISILLVLIYPLPDDIRNFIIIGFAGIIVFAALLYFVIRSLSRSGTQAGFILFLKRFFSSFTVLNGPYCWQTIFLSLSLWFLYWICTHLIQMALHLDMAAYESLIVLIIGTVAISIPSAPGMIGTYHAGIKYIMTDILGGYTAADGINYAILLHGYAYIVFIALGGWYFFRSQFHKGTISKLFNREVLDHED